MKTLNNLYIKLNDTTVLEIKQNKYRQAIDEISNKFKTNVIEKLKKFERK